MQIGYTRDHDNPDADTRGSPFAGQMARFFYDYKQKHDMGGIAQNLPSGEPDMAKILYVEISTGADPNSKSVQKVTEAHKVNYKRFWEAFNRQEDFTKAAGTQLNLLSELDLIQQYQIQGLAILSIEELANVQEGILLQHTWLRHWKNKAQGYLIEHKPKPDAALMNQLAELQAQINQLKTAGPALVEFITPEEKAARDAERSAAASANKPDPAKTKPGGWPKGKPRKAKSQDPADEAITEKDEVAA